MEETRQIIETTSLTDREYKLFSSLVYDKFGINLGEQKKTLISGRLNKVLRQNNFSSFKQYYDYLIADSSGQSLMTLIDRISTNHTFFNRENDHFNFFSEIALPEIVDNLKKHNECDIRIWSAGCSSGEESYTLAMFLLEHFKYEASSWDLGILATDISSTALQKANSGIYESENAARLPEQLRNKYMRRLPEGNWIVDDSLRRIILYRRFNLIGEKYPFKKKFQAIFCRNVMIYFDRPMREMLIKRFYDYIEDYGYLFIGHSETLGRDNIMFRYVKPAVYRKVKN